MPGTDQGTDLGQELAASLWGLTASTSTSLRSTTGALDSKTAIPVSAASADRAAASGSLATTPSARATPAQQHPPDQGRRHLAPAEESPPASPHRVRGFADPSYITARAGHELAPITVHPGLVEPFVRGGSRPARVSRRIRPSLSRFKDLPQAEGTVDKNSQRCKPVPKGVIRTS